MSGAASEPGLIVLNPVQLTVRLFVVSATLYLFTMKGDWPDVTSRSLPLTLDLILSDMVGPFGVQKLPAVMLLYWAH